jgi:hypothetical protein
MIIGNKKSETRERKRKSFLSVGRSSQVDSDSAARVLSSARSKWRIAAVAGGACEGESIDIWCMRCMGKQYAIYGYWVWSAKAKSDSGIELV